MTAHGSQLGVDSGVGPLKLTYFMGKCECIRGESRASEHLAYEPIVDDVFPVFLRSARYCCDLKLSFRHLFFFAAK